MGKHDKTRRRCNFGLEAIKEASASGTISYPMTTPEVLLHLRDSLSWTDEVQHTNISGEDQDLSHDRVTIRFGTSINKCSYGCLGLDFQFL